MNIPNARRELTNDQLRSNIEDYIINPTIETEIKGLIKARTLWKTISHTTELLGYILIVLATIFAFLDKLHTILTFVAGCLNTTALALLKFSDYANNESKERTEVLNTLLIRLNITGIPSPVLLSPVHTASVPRPSIISYESV